MYSFAFPDIFKGSRTALINNKDAAKNNLRLVLLSSKLRLLGDPYFGTNLRKYVFEPNNIYLRDLIVDEVYTAIKVFVPQVQVNRGAISVSSDGVNVMATIQYIYLADTIPDMFTINLTEDKL